MGKKFTAKVFVSAHEDVGDGQTRLRFSGDYANNANKEWSKYTPNIGIDMTVLNSVAEGLAYGDKATLTFEFPSVATHGEIQPGDSDG